jgi:hypothetical protein
VGTLLETSENQSIRKKCHHPKMSEIYGLSGNVSVFREQKFIRIFGQQNRGGMFPEDTQDIPCRTHMIPGSISSRIKRYFFSKIFRTALKPLSLPFSGHRGSCSGNEWKRRGVILTTNPNLYNIFHYAALIKKIDIYFQDLLANIIPGPYGKYRYYS